MCRDLLLLLESDSRVRADVVRQFHERGEEKMVDVLAEIEADGQLRRQLIEALRSVGED